MYQRQNVPEELSLFETGDPESVRAAGPSIGPIHTGVIPPPADLRKGVPADAVLSPLAITLRGLRRSPYRRQEVSQIVVHMTGSGPVGRSKKAGYKRPAVEFALDWYLNGGPNGGFAHYVVDFPGTIYATCDERFVAYHAGWVHEGGKALFRNPAWQAPAWWKAVWGRFGFRSPLDLLPAGASGPNSYSIGIELMVTSRPVFTDAQYRALARLISDIARRHSIPIQSVPGPTLLGHEDYAPIVEGGRANAGGGWDPGAHRTNPYFSWSKLASYLSAAPQTPAAVPSTTALPSSTTAVRPPIDPSAYRKFRLTAYHIADQGRMPTGNVRIPIYDANRTRIADASPAFFADLSLQGSGRLVDGRLINVTGGKHKWVPVNHDEYAAVLALHQRIYSKPAPTAYSGIIVKGGRVTHAFAFHVVPPSRRGIGYGHQNRVDLRPFRTLAADIGRTEHSEPRWRGKGGLVPPRTRVYIKEFDGRQLPDGTRHDGWFVVNDTGGAIFGAHFDVFVGDRALRNRVPQFGNVWFPGIENRIPAGYTYGLTK